jgi:hypothetical protein
MKLISKALLAAVALAACALSPANAYENAVTGQTKAGLFIGSSAGVPPPGIYMFNQEFTVQQNFTGPGTGNAPGPFGHNSRIGVQAAVDVQGFLFVPGWTFLGATYDALIVQPFELAAIGQPINFQASGVHNTFIVPVELSWKLGTSGLAVKAGLGVYVPTGTIQGVNGFGNVGNAYYTAQPELIVSYLKDGWNLSAALYEEFNSAGRDNYTQGNIFHADFTVTKTIGKWTLGPVAYYYAQVSDDKCPTGVCTTINANTTTPTGVIFGNAQRFQVFAVGGLVEYNFGPASLSVWATQEISAKASNANSAAIAGADTSVIPQGMTVLATLSYRLWAPDEPAKPKMFHK